jgi:GT2 family glycosyltransferase
VTLSIVIINYNTFQVTCDCIRSIKETANVPYEIILIDNNSKECKASEFLKIFPGIRLFALEENVGFGRANNFGMNKAEGKYILLLNSDTIVHEHTIDETVQYLEEHGDVDILGCRAETLYGTQRTVYEYEGQASLLKTAVVFTKRNAVMRELLKPIHKLLNKKEYSEPAATTAGPEPQPAANGEEIRPNYYKGKRIGVLVGVFLLFKREVYLESKGFDPDFFMYHEELEWFLNRLKKYNMVFYPNVAITHLFGKSDVYNKMSFQNHVSHYLFWYKMSYLHFVLYFFFNVVELPSRLLVGAFTLRKEHFRHVLTIIKGFPYALFDVPRYSNNFGSRREMLKLRSLKRNNL